MEAGMSDWTQGPDGRLSPEAEEGILLALRDFFEATDPVPPTLAERVCFVLALEEHEEELLLSLDPELAGARSEDRVRTVTFSSPRLSVMVTIGDDDGGRARIDGWIDAPDGGGRLRVELRRPASPEPDGLAASPVAEGVADEDGRFSFDAVPRGFVQFAFHAPSGEPARLPRSVVTPAIQV
jgi:hypothetical protein